MCVCVCVYVCMCVYVCVCVLWGKYEQEGTGSNFKNKDFLSNFFLMRESDILVAYLRM
jgi:hypothetical protein